MRHPTPFLFFLLLLLLLLTFTKIINGNTTNDEGNLAAGSNNISWLPVGLILSMNSDAALQANSCISMAISDFYSTHPTYKTRLSLHTRYAEDVVDTASSALELMKNEQVQAIIGPLSSSQTTFLINLGEKAQVPILSFSATSSFLSPTQHPFFIRTAQDDAYQAQAIASIIQAYGWQNVVLIYEDTEYGNGLIPYLADAFQKIDTQVPYRYVVSPNSDDLTILKQLNKLVAGQGRVFLVHMKPSLGSRVFMLAKEANMMSKGYVWIKTDGLTSVIGGKEVMHSSSMKGVLGVKPHIPKSKRLRDFERRWNLSYFSHENTKMKLNVLDLWAYDTIWALALAAEKSAAQNTNTGEGLVRIISSTKFRGVSGNFELENGQLQPSVFEIINVKDKGEEVIGYWDPNKGIENTIEAPIWPGNAKSIPKGWTIPIVGKKLRVGVPVIPTDGYSEFAEVEWDPYTNESSVRSGFPIDIFKAALESLPFAVPYEFIPFANESRQIAGSYDKLLDQIKLDKFDAVVGDVTISASRASKVDFTLPYMDSGVVMIVKIKDDERKNMWVFLKPLSWDLWLTIGVAIIVTGIVVWIMEHHINTDFRGSPQQQIGTIFWFSFSTLVFAHRERVLSNFSRTVLIVWTFVVLILTQSYTASLSSMLTVQRMQPGVVDVEDLRRIGDFVGYPRNSFVKDLLINQLKFDRSKIIPYRSTREVYHEALSKGSKNGGVTAIFDEIPYMKLFLSKYCSEYTMVEPIYRTSGFGFAFPQGSPLVPYISRAILNITQDYDLMKGIEDKYFQRQSTCQYPGSRIDSDSPSLSVYSFAGLFIITGITSVFGCLAYLIYFVYKEWPAFNAMHSESSLRSKFVKFWTHFVNHFNQNDHNNRGLEKTEPKVPPAAIGESNGSDSNSGTRTDSSFQIHSHSSNQVIESVASDEDEDHPNDHYYGCA